MLEASPWEHTGLFLSSAQPSVSLVNAVDRLPHRLPWTLGTRNLKAISNLAVVLGFGSTLWVEKSLGWGLSEAGDME